MALRNKSFGSAQEFVWAADSSEYAVRENASTVKLFKNFKEKKTFKPDFGAEQIFGGFMLGVKSPSGELFLVFPQYPFDKVDLQEYQLRLGLSFYDWESLELVRRIEIQPRSVYWSENGELVCISTDDSYFILSYDSEAVVKARETKEDISDDGIESAFNVIKLP